MYRTSAHRPPALLSVILEHLGTIPLESHLRMTADPLTQHRLPQTIPSGIQKIRQSRLNSGLAAFSPPHRSYAFRDEGFNLREFQIQRKTHEERDGIAVSLPRRSDSVDSRPDSALGRGLKGIAKIDDEGPGDGIRWYPSAVFVEDLETSFCSDLVEECEPAA